MWFSPHRHSPEWPQNGPCFQESTGWLPADLTSDQSGETDPQFPSAGVACSFLLPLCAEWLFPAARFQPAHNDRHFRHPVQTGFLRAEPVQQMCGEYYMASLTDALSVPPVPHPDGKRPHCCPVPALWPDVRLFQSPASHCPGPAAWPYPVAYPPD